MEYLSAHLRSLRALHNLSLTEAADEAALSKSTLSRIESGQQVPSLHQLQRLAELYATTTSKMLDGRRIDELVPIKHKMAATFSVSNLLVMIYSSLFSEEMVGASVSIMLA